MRAAGAVAFLLTLVVLGLQWQSGAYEAEFCAFPDEPGHFVTGLMVHDYLASGFRQTPYAFATDYYVHYPSIAFGHWPPGYYALQAVWYFIAGVSRASPLILNGLLTMATGLLLWGFARSRYGEVPAVLIAAGYTLVGSVQEVSYAVMAEPLMILTALGAVMALGAFLERGATSSLAVYSVLTIILVLSRTLGWCVAPIPIVAAIVSRRWDLLRQVRFWAYTLAVFAAGASWELTISNPVRTGYTPEAEQQSVLLPLMARSFKELTILAQEISWPVLLFALVGAGSVLALSVRRRGGGQLLPHLLLVAGTLSMVLISPINLAARYLMLAIPSSLILAAEGCRVAVDFLSPRIAPRAAATVLTALLAVSFAVSSLELHHKDSRGYREVVDAALGVPGRANEVILISSLAGGEPIFVSEVALRENPPKRFVIRAAKLLSNSPWSLGHRYEPFVGSAADTMEMILEPPVGVVVLHEDKPWAKHKHHYLLREALEGNPVLWAPVADLPVVSRVPAGSAHMQVFRLTDFDSRPRRPIRLDMSSRLGHEICEKGPCGDEIHDKQ